MIIIEFNGEAVIETRELAKLYGQTPDEITKAFTQHEEQFKEGEHYYLLDSRFEDFEEFKREYLDQGCEELQKVYLWTDQGLYEHASLLKGKQAWHCYCQFIYYVFHQLEEVKQAIQVLQKAEDLITKENFLYYLAKELI